MKRLNKILSDSRFIERVDDIKRFEIERKFCRHDIEHFKNVSRILYILSLENRVDVSKEIIYTIGMLHDIGRGVQYEDGTPHEIAGAAIAKELMSDYDYHIEEIETVERAILSHRRFKKDGTLLERLTYRADKLSRDCGFCDMSLSCNWHEDEKNNEIKY